MPQQMNRNGDFPFLSEDGLYVVDGDRRIVSWNAAAERLTGYARHEVLGLPCYEVVGGIDTRNRRICQRNCPILADAKRGRPTPGFDIIFRSRGGGPLWLNVSIMVPRQAASGFGLVHLFRDVTEQRIAEVREQFHSMASHELKTALTPIKVCLEMLSAAEPTPSNEDLTKRLIDIMKRSYERLEERVNGLLAPLETSGEQSRPRQSVETGQDVEGPSDQAPPRR